MNHPSRVICMGLKSVLEFRNKVQKDRRQNETIGHPCKINKRSLKLIGSLLKTVLHSIFVV